MEDQLKLIRHRLATIDLSDAQDDGEMSTSEYREYSAAIFAVFPRIEKDIRKFMFRQLLFNAKESANWDQVIVGRGVLEGMAMLLEHWQTVASSYEQPKETYDEHSPLGEV